MISMLGSLMSALAGLRSEHIAGCGGHAGVARLDLEAARRARAEKRDLEPYLEAASPGGGKAPGRGARGRARPPAGGGCTVIRFRKRA